MSSNYSTGKTSITGNVSLAGKTTAHTYASINSNATTTIYTAPAGGQYIKKIRWFGTGTAVTQIQAKGEQLAFTTNALVPQGEIEFAEDGLLLAQNETIQFITSGTSSCLLAVSVDRYI